MSEELIPKSFNGDGESKKANERGLQVLLDNGMMYMYYYCFGGK
jgi:hypothetical protein